MRWCTLLVWTAQSADSWILLQLLLGSAGWNSLPAFCATWSWLNVSAIGIFKEENIFWLWLLVLEPQPPLSCLDPVSLLGLFHCLVL